MSIPSIEESGDDEDIVVAEVSASPSKKGCFSLSIEVIS